MWHNDWGWWLVMPLTTGLLLLALVWALLTSARSPGAARSGPDPEAEAERILDQRYACGEIDDAEYEHRLAVLRDAASRSHAP